MYSIHILNDKLKIIVLTSNQTWTDVGVKQASEASNQKCCDVKFCAENIVLYSL